MEEVAWMSIFKLLIVWTPQTIPPVTNAWIAKTGPEHNPFSLCVFLCFCVCFSRGSPRPINHSCWKYPGPPTPGGIRVNNTGFLNISFAFKKALALLTLIQVHQALLHPFDFTTQGSFALWRWFAGCLSRISRSCCISGASWHATAANYSQQTAVCTNKNKCV